MSTNNVISEDWRDQDTSAAALMATVKQGDNSHVALSQPPASFVAPNTAGPGASNQTLKQFSSSGGVSINAGATVNLYTVTTGKTFYITDVFISTDDATPILVQIKQGSTVIFEEYFSTTAPVDACGIETQPQAPSAAVVSIVFPTAAGKNAAYFIAGYEQ